MGRIINVDLGDCCMCGGKGTYSRTSDSATEVELPRIIFNLSWLFPLDYDLGG